MGTNAERIAGELIQRKDTEPIGEYPECLIARIKDKNRERSVRARNKLFRRLQVRVQKKPRCQTTRVRQTFSAFPIWFLECDAPAQKEPNTCFGIRCWSPELGGINASDGELQVAPSTNFTPSIWRK